MNALKSYRIAKGLTQVEIAKVLGVKQGTISKIENGELPSLQLAAKIERATRKKILAASWIPEPIDSGEAGQ